MKERAPLDAEENSRPDTWAAACHMPRLCRTAYPSESAPFIQLIITIIINRIISLKVLTLPQPNRDLTVLTVSIDTQKWWRSSASRQRNCDRLFERIKNNVLRPTEWPVSSHKKIVKRFKQIIKERVSTYGSNRNKFSAKFLEKN